MDLPPHPTWQVYDSTKVRAFCRCPRMYFFEYVLGWRPSHPSIHLEFGKAMHKAMEVLLLCMKKHGCYTIPETEHAATVFSEACAESNIEDLGHDTKNLANGILALWLYASKYANDHFDVAFPEVAQTVLLDEETPFFVKADGVCMDEKGPFTIEHKTASKDEGNRGEYSWHLATQIGAQTHLLDTYFEPAEGKQRRVLMNFIVLRKLPALKKDGTPYANSGVGNEVYRYEINKTPEAQAAWLSNTLYQVGLIRWNHIRLLDLDSPNRAAMTSFPHNESSCLFCSYLDLCHMWPNPLKRALGEPPVGFKREYWDPRNETTNRLESVK